MADEKDTLAAITSPGVVEIFPGIKFEDKMRIRTQRALERHFKTAIAYIFPGIAKEPDGTLKKWTGIDFAYLDNLVPLITIMAQQGSPEVTEEYVENILDGLPDNEITAGVQRLIKFFVPTYAPPKNENPQPETITA